MAAAAFSIRGYAASMRGEGAAEGLRQFGFETLPPMEAPRFRWWADELASAVAAAEAPAPALRRSLGKAKAPKKRSISDLFAAAPPLDVPAGESGGNDLTEVEGDEALCAILRRAKAEKKRKKRLREAATATAAAGETSGTREADGNFPRKEALDQPDLLDGLDNQAPSKPEGVQDLRNQKEKIAHIMKKNSDAFKYTESKKASKVVKSRDMGKRPPLQSILKKYTKRTSVKMVKEKHGSLNRSKVIELYSESVKRVTFSETNNVLGCKKQISKLPKRRSLGKLFSDDMASSSSSSSMSMSDEGDRCIAAENSSSHRSEVAFSETEETNKDTEHADSHERNSRELSSPLFDLNEAVPESTDLNYLYDSNPVVPNLGNAHAETLNSDVEVVDGTENHRDWSFDSHGQECQLSATDLEKGRNSKSAGTFLHDEAAEVSDTEIVLPPRELASTHRDSCNASVKDNWTMGTSRSALPDRTVEGSFQQQSNWFFSNLNNGGSQLSTGEEFRARQSRECNKSRNEKLHSHSELNVQHVCGPSTGQTVRLMGKDLAVSTSRGECSAGMMAQKHTGSSLNDNNLATNVCLELPRPGQPFLSLQAQSLPNVSANSGSTSHVSANSASTSRAHLGYRISHELSHPFPAVNAFFGGRVPYEHRSRDFSNPEPNQNVPLGGPPTPNHDIAAFHQKSPSVSHYYSNPFSRTEPPSAAFLLATKHLAPSSFSNANVPQLNGVRPESSSVLLHPSVSHATLRRPYGVHSASSSVLPRNHGSFTFSQEAFDSRRDDALPSRNLENGMVTVVPDNSRSSSSGRQAQRSGPVKLTPGAKHILVPSDTTGDDNPVPVYSCISFGFGSGNASASQNNGAELYKF